MQPANATEPAATGRSDAECFVLTRELTGISEFEVFRCAYRFWYGREADEATLESAFGAYLRSGELPMFARHFARRYVAEHGDEVRAAVQRERRAWRVQRTMLALIAITVLAALLWGALR